MGEKEDEPFVGKGSYDCAPISVSDRCVSARIHACECQPDTTLQLMKEKGLCAESLETPSAESIQNEYSDVEGKGDLRAQIKSLRTPDNETINGIRDSVLSTNDIRTTLHEKGKFVAPARTNGSCDLISCSVAKEETTKQEEKRRFRITPRPFKAESKGATNRRSYAGSLISDEPSSTKQTYSTSAPLCDGSVWRETSILKNTANKEKVDPNGFTPAVDAGASTSTGDACVSHTHAQALTVSLSVELTPSATQTENKNNQKPRPGEEDGKSRARLSTQAGESQSLADRVECTSVGQPFSEMGNSQHREFLAEMKKSKQTPSATTPSVNLNINSEGCETEPRPLSCTIPELVISDSSVENADVASENPGGQQDVSAKITSAENPQLRPHTSSDSAYSSDSRCTSMDSAWDPAVRGEDGDFGDQDNSLLSPPNTASDTKSVSSSSSSSSSSPSHSGIAGSAASSESTLRVMSEYGMQRKLSSSSGSSFRSSLSFEESEDDMLSSDGEIRDQIAAKGRRQSKAQSSWTKIRRMVIWSPFMQSFKKKYPWVQLAGHAGNFQPGEEGCILKKYCAREACCLSQLCNDVALKPYAPEYHGLVDKEGERYTRMQDLLLAFDCPSVMDCKMGVRTYLEDELVKAKIKPRLRHDMYKKMTEISPNEPTPEEHEAKAVTKPRYMQWREHVSSSSNLGFRIEGIKKGDNEPSKDYKLTKTKEQVKTAFKYFIDEKVEVLEKYIKRLKEIRAAAEKSEFFMSHEVIGSSLLFVHDQTGLASAWMIDFGKTSQLPDNKKLTHREEWVEGNREDGYLFGLDNLISIFEEILIDLHSRIPNETAEEKSVPGDDASNKTGTHSLVTWTLSSQSSGDSFDSAPTPLDSPSIAASDPSFDQDSPRKPPLRRQVAATDSYDDSTEPKEEHATSTNHVINDVTRNSRPDSSVDGKDGDVITTKDTNNASVGKQDNSGTT